MTSNIRLINPMRDKHMRNGKELLEGTCDAIEHINSRVAGYVVMAWDERGRTYSTYRAGGAVAPEMLPEHIDKIIKATMRG